MNKQLNVIRKDITQVNYGIIAHGVNCQAVMQSGVALQLRKTYPECYESYRDFCADNMLNKTEHLLGLTDLVNINANLIIANCFTQVNYGYDGKGYASIWAIRDCLHSVFRHGERMYLPVYIPQIGCGLGGLDWETEVLPLVQKVSSCYHVEVNVCVKPE